MTLMSKAHLVLKYSLAGLLDSLYIQYIHHFYSALRYMLKLFHPHVLLYEFMYMQLLTYILY